jgi:hypothetical protein
MLLRLDQLDRIVAGDVDVVFRLWRKPTVKAGGRLRTARGELAIEAVDEIDPTTITLADAQRAGFASADEARASVAPRPVKASPGRTRTAKPDETSRVYRVTVRYAGVDSRAALREDVSPDAIAAVVAKLDAMDSRSARGPWTRRTLDLIATWPGRRAPELAEMESLETVVFKTDVRKLKELGLTISLSVGYEVSPRGEAVRAASPRS